MKFALKKGITDPEKPASKMKSSRIIAAIIITTFILFSVLIINKLANNRAAQSEYAGTVQTRWDACKLFSLSDAKNVLGSKAEVSNNNANAVSSKASVSTCSYSSGGANAEDLVALTVLVRSSNRIQARQAFEVARPKDAVDIKDLGDQANYSAQTGQINMLSGENWVIIALTKGSSGGDGLASSSKKVAEIIDSRL